MVSDEALLERLAAGEMSAFDALYERYERRLFGFIRRQLSDAQEAEDVLHETFLALLREQRAGQVTTSVHAWLYQVARNGCLNRLRSRRRAARALALVSVAPREPAARPDDTLTKRQAAERLRAAVRRLPQALAELFELRAGGLSYDELAAVLEVPVGTVKSRLHEMVHRLREEMAR